MEEQHDEHKAAHVVVAEVADEAHKMAEEAKEVAENAQQVANEAAESTSDALMAPPVVVADEPEKAAESEPDHFAEINTKLTSIGERLDGYEQRFSKLETPPEPEPTTDPDVIEVETEPQPKTETKPETKSESKPKSENKEGKTSDKPREANPGRRFSRGRR